MDKPLAFILSLRPAWTNKKQGLQSDIIFNYQTAAVVITTLVTDTN